MTKKQTNILLCSGSLALGCLIYILFRVNSYIGKLFGEFYVTQGLREAVSWLACDYVKYYFPDYLWGFSLCCGLCAIYGSLRKGIVLCGLAGTLCGCIWEIMQYAGIVNGTGDIWDMLMYLGASATCIFINLRREDHEKD